MGKLMGCSLFYLVGASFSNLYLSLASLRKQLLNASDPTRRPDATSWAHLLATVSHNPKQKQKPFCKYIYPIQPSTEYPHSFAGAEASTAAVRATLFCMATNPYIYSTFLAELSSSIISHPNMNEEIRKLSYPQAAIKEGRECV
jgi:hypothetical protein